MKRPRFAPSLADRRRANQAALDYYRALSPRDDAPVIDTGARPKRRLSASSNGEATVLRDVSKLVRYHPRVASAERRNSGSALNAAGQYVPFQRSLKGAATVLDVEGKLTDGRPFGIECKRPGWKPAKSGATFEREERQRERIAEIRRLGGVAGFASSVEQAMEVLK